MREWLATLRDSEDLVSVGAYVAGSNPRIDTALARRDAIERFSVKPPTPAAGSPTRPPPFKGCRRCGPFRFRAQAALDLRISQEEQAAQGACACAGIGAARADARMPRLTARRRPIAQFQSAQQDGANGWRIGWHRNWIAQQRLAVDVRQREAAISAAVVERAAARFVIRIANAGRSSGCGIGRAAPTTSRSGARTLAK